MRIGIDIRAVGNQRTGDETYTVQLIRALAKEDVKNEYFLYTDVFDEQKINKIKKILSVDNGNFKVISVGPTGKLLWTFFSLTKRAIKDKLDILHVQYITPWFLRGRVKVVTTIHDISFVRYPRFINWKDLIILKFFIRKSLKMADAIIAVSEFTKKEIIDVYGLRGGKIQVILNGGVSDEFVLAKNKKNDVLSFKKKYGIVKPYLLYLGTLQPRKNIPFLIESFVELKNSSENFEVLKDLSLVIRGKRGGYNYDQEIDTVLEEVKYKFPNVYKQIKFVDYIENEELPLIFKGAEVFCFVSLYEGFGLPLLEAMFMETPVVANDQSCLREIIGSAGLIYENGNKGDFNDRIIKILTDDKLKQDLVQKGTERTSEFSWQKNAYQTLQLYNKLK